MVYLDYAADHEHKILEQHFRDKYNKIEVESHFCHHVFRSIGAPTSSKDQFMHWTLTAWLAVDQRGA